MVDQASTADVTADVSDEQFDKYFESGGESGLGETPEEPTEGLKDEPVAETEEEVESEAEPDQKAERNYKAMAHEERERRKEMNKQLQDQQAKVQKLEQTFQRMMEQAQYQQQQAQLQQQQAMEPSFEEDPLNALRRDQERIKQALQQQHQTVAEQQRMAQMEQNQQNFVNRYHDSAQSYAKEQTDFKEAYAFLNNQRLTELKDGGFTDQEAKQIILEDEMSIVSRAFNDGVNPAERVYKIAKARGYQVVANKVDAANTAEQRIAQLEKGVAASKSLGSAGGKSDKGALTLEAVANMDDDEFARVDWNKLMKQG